jgi:hypothetical protein
MSPDRTSTAREFCAALRAAGIDADLDDYALARGDLLDGRGWILSSPFDEGYDTPDEPLPEPLDLFLYESETENAAAWPDGVGVPFNEAFAWLPGCTAAQAAHVIRLAESGDYSQFQLNRTVPQLRTARPVEGTLAPDGTPLFTPPVRDYLRAVRRAEPETIAPWMRATCPECGQVAACPQCGRAVRADGVDFAPDGTAAHVVLHGSVILDCKGRAVPSPAVVGIQAGSWQGGREQAGQPPVDDRERAGQRADDAGSEEPPSGTAGVNA